MNNNQRLLLTWMTEAMHSRAEAKKNCSQYDVNGFKLTQYSQQGQEIDIIKKISKKVNFKNNDQIIIDFTEIDNKNYHDGIKFTFFAKDVRGEVASGGRYKIKRNATEESAVGFTCFMDTVLRASSFENSKRKISLRDGRAADIGQSDSNCGTDVALGLWLAVLLSAIQIH